ncbi:uncharacterized protein cd34 isoform X2 [Siphateles boraxobius]|uniref:uncharacterized protein cd34 isoform X2 n=1 Tax=Siphateles boraxobius TaxID=180520 RepID=UPI004064A7E6
MAVQRLNELWKTMALAFMFGFLLLHSCQGQDPPAPGSKEEPEKNSTANHTEVSPTNNTATQNTCCDKSTVPPTSLTTEFKVQSTSEPNKPSSVYTTQQNTPSETIASGNSVPTTLIPFPPDQPETTAPNDHFKGIMETVNPASNQESRHSETGGNGTSGSSPAVFVSVLVSGLLLAAIIVGIFYFKCHRRTNSKGMKLAEESYMADEENQGNTLVSVAPLNQPEPQEKPSLNGESQEAVKPQTLPAATNGHSTTKTADTEL